MSQKIKHKTEGWTGTIEKVVESTNYWSSHSVRLTVVYQIYQDAYDQDGKYHEDPDIDSIDDLEFLPTPPNPIQENGGKYE